jgi:hypothetical protein
MIGWVSELWADMGHVVMSSSCDMGKHRQSLLLHLSSRQACPLCEWAASRYFGHGHCVLPAGCVDTQAPC